MNIKRRFADRRAWMGSTIIDKSFILLDHNDSGFEGHISIMRFNQILKPIHVDVAESKLCLLEKNYIWISHYPKGKNYVLTTMCTDNLEVIQWYYDVTREYQVGMDGIPFSDDLFLDVAILNSGKILLLDEEELQQAYSENNISQAEVILAQKTANELIKMANENSCALKSHSQVIIKQLESGELKFN